MDSENTVPAAAEPKDPELPAPGGRKKKQSERTKKKKRERKKRESVESKPFKDDATSTAKDEHSNSAQKDEKTAARKITFSILRLGLFHRPVYLP